MSLIKAIKAQLGLSVTPANNFTLDASADNGTMKLARGNAGATTQDIMTVDADGKVAFPVVASPGKPYLAVIGTNQITVPPGLGTQTGFGALIVGEDPDNIVEPANGVVRIPVTGYYQINVRVNYAQNGVNATNINAYVKADADIVVGSAQGSDGGVIYPIVCGSDIVHLNAGQGVYPATSNNGVANAVNVNAVMSLSLLRQG